jgi:hypothetical protein
LNNPVNQTSWIRVAEAKMAVKVCGSYSKAAISIVFFRD